MAQGGVETIGHAAGPHHSCAAREGGIADTGVLVAFANADDAPHGWATQIVARVTELLTCEAVLAETAFHLEARRWLSRC
jgi:hypothetical protein